MGGLTPVHALHGLRRGQVVLVKGCRVCGRQHVHNLLQAVDVARGHWATRGRLHNQASAVVSLEIAFAEKRLFLFKPGSVQEGRGLEDLGD